MPYASVAIHQFNGWFKSLESIVHCYNTAFLGSEGGRGPDIPDADTTAAEYGIERCPDDIQTEKDALANNCWPAPAYTNGIPMPFLLWDLHLTPEEEAAIVAYLKTLTDDHTAKAPDLYKEK